MRLVDSYIAAAEAPQAVKLADLAYINTERSAAGATPDLMDFVTRWMTERDMQMGLACFDLLREKKCPPGGQQKSLTRQDGETPSIVHELSQALYTISLVEAGYKLPDVEMLLCLNFTHDLGEEFDITEDSFRQNLRDHHVQLSERTELLGKLFENMTKSRGVTYKYENNQDYFDTMLEHPATVIAKFQDRIHNMATLIGVKKLDKHRSYITETIDLRDTLKQAETLYPEFAPVFDIMHRIVNTQIYYNAFFLDRTNSGKPIDFATKDMPRLRRIYQLPEGIDPLMITEARAENKLKWMSAYQRPPIQLAI